MAISSQSAARQLDVRVVHRTSSQPCTGAAIQACGTGALQSAPGTACSRRPSSSAPMASCMAVARRRDGCAAAGCASVGSPRTRASSLVTAMMVASSGEGPGSVCERGCRGSRLGRPTRESPSLTPAADRVSSASARPLNTCRTTGDRSTSTCEGRAGPAARPNGRGHGSPNGRAAHRCRPVERRRPALAAREQSALPGQGRRAGGRLPKFLC